MYGEIMIWWHIIEYNPQWYGDCGMGPSFKGSTSTKWFCCELQGLTQTHVDQYQGTSIAQYNSSIYKWMKNLQHITKEEWWSPWWNPENSPATSAMAHRGPRSGPFWSPQVWPATDKRSVAHQCHDPRHSCSRPWESLGLADWDLQALVDTRWYYKIL